MLQPRCSGRRGLDRAGAFINPANLLFILRSLELIVDDTVCLAPYSFFLVPLRKRDYLCLSRRDYTLYTLLAEYGVSDPFPFLFLLFFASHEKPCAL